MRQVGKLHLLFFGSLQPRYDAVLEEWLLRGRAIPFVCSSPINEARHSTRHHVKKGEAPSFGRSTDVKRRRSATI